MPGSASGTKVMVIGGAGFLGSHLVERLLADGHSVDAVDDLSTGSLANLATARSLGADLSIHTLDVNAPEFAALAAIRAPDVLYHLAWDRAGELGGSGAAAAVHSTVAVLDAAQRLGAKAVVSLPAAPLYGSVAARDLPVKEGHPWSPVGVRGVVAQAIAGLLATYRALHTVEHTVFATACVYGPRQRAEAGVVAAFIAAAQRAEAPTIHGDGRQTRDFLFVDDAVDAMARATNQGDGLVINIGTGVGTAIRDLWTLIAPTGAPAHFDETHPDEIGRFAVSPVRARIHLSWAPWTELARGLETLR